MVSLLIQILILCLILGLVIYIFQNVPILAPFAWLAKVICVAIVVVFLIEFLLGVQDGSAPLGWSWRLK